MMLTKIKEVTAVLDLMSGTVQDKRELEELLAALAKAKDIAMTVAEDTGGEGGDEANKLVWEALHGRELMKVPGIEIQVMIYSPD